MIAAHELGQLAANARRRRHRDRTLRDESAWMMTEAEELEPLLTVDPELGDSPVKLVDARFLIGLANSGGRLPRRQDMPDAAFLSLRRLRRMHLAMGFDNLRVICLSHMWLQPDHPDPKGSTLRLLGLALQRFVEYHTKRRATFCGQKLPWTASKTPAGTFAVFVDYCSLHQKDASGGRTVAEAALFKRALARLDDLYSHPHTFLLKVTRPPHGYPDEFAFPADATPNIATYDERGW